MLITDIIIEKIYEHKQSQRHFQGLHKEKRGCAIRGKERRFFDAFLSAETHMTLKSCLPHIKNENPGIGYATVHRNLCLLCECGLADEIKIGKQKTRYEPKFGQKHHDHLICLKCGRFIEVNDTKIEKLQEKLTEANDFIPVRHKLEIYGICRECK